MARRASPVPPDFITNPLFASNPSPVTQQGSICFPLKAKAPPPPPSLLLHLLLLPFFHTRNPALPLSTHITPPGVT